MQKRYEQYVHKAIQIMQNIYKQDMSRKWKWNKFIDENNDDNVNFPGRDKLKWVCFILCLLYTSRCV